MFLIRDNYKEVVPIMYRTMTTREFVDPESQPYLIEHCMEYTLPSSGWTLQGYSIAGVRTGFRIKEKKILLDAGVACDVKNTLLCITHTHTDHTLNLPVVCTPWRPITAICNEHTHSTLVPFMQSVDNMCDSGEGAGDSGEVTEGAKGTEGTGESEGGNNNNQSATFVPVKNGDSFSAPNIKGMWIDTFHCYHTVECTAYGFSDVRNKLKQEYAGISGKELGQLRKQGVQVTEEVHVPQLLFCGDTSVEFFERASPQIFTFPVIMVECTSIEEDEASMAKSRERGHMNLFALKPFILQHPEITFILFHHSQKNHHADIVKKCHDLPNVVNWVGPCWY